MQQALAGDHQAIARLIDELTPIIQMRVARALLRLRKDVQEPGIRHEVEDLCQEVFLVLFADQGRVLRSWDRQRGLSLWNFVGLVAERRALSLLRTGRSNPWTEDPTGTGALDREAPAPGPEGIAVSRDLLHHLLLRLEEALSPLGRHLFELLFIRELSVTEIMSETGLSADAVYAWRSRLRRRAQQLLVELTSEIPASRQSPLCGAV